MTSVERDRRTEEERRRMREDLAEVGENLPDDLRGVEGADVREVVRHRRPPEEAND